jgi:hypothetical protein
MAAFDRHVPSVQTLATLRLSATVSLRLAASAAARHDKIACKRLTDRARQTTAWAAQLSTGTVAFLELQCVLAENARNYARRDRLEQAIVEIELEMGQWPDRLATGPDDLNRGPTLRDRVN